MNSSCWSSVKILNCFSYSKRFLKLDIMECGSDLSEYEKIRYENIRRNNEFLRQLGLSVTSHENKNNGINNTQKNKDSNNDELIIERKKKRERNLQQLNDVNPKRRSTRIVLKEQNLSFDSIDNINQDENEEEDEDENNKKGFSIDYDNYEPQVIEELDDFEFLVFVLLRKWRLMKCRELEIEPYKIFQNRTIIEVIRRRRNNNNWCKEDNTIYNDLLECWGIGPSKVIILLLFFKLFLNLNIFFTLFVLKIII